MQPSPDVDLPFTEQSCQSPCRLSAGSPAHCMAVQDADTTTQAPGDVRKHPPQPLLPAGLQHCVCPSSLGANRLPGQRLLSFQAACSVLLGQRGSNDLQIKSEPFCTADDLSMPLAHKGSAQLHHKYTARHPQQPCGTGRAQPAARCKRESFW